MTCSYALENGSGMMGMHRAARLLCGLFCLLICVQAAEARRFRIIPIPGMGSSETIDLVHDLPNEEPFVNEGAYLDVGYLNGRNGNAYVLYHDDRYRKLDDQDIALLTTALGFDPTAQHRARLASAAATPSKGSGAGFVGLGAIGLILLLVLIFVGRKLYGGVFRLARTVSGSETPDPAPADSADHGSFDDRVAKRLAELRGGPGGSAGRPEGEGAAAPPPAARPVVRAFGRKLA